MLLPKLIREKIDFYIWRNKMLLCNTEYYRFFEWSDYLEYMTITRCFNWNSYTLNDRRLDMFYMYITKKGIYDRFRIGPVANLPKNYCYSNESFGFIRNY
jgi:hypothetical protein